MTTTPRTELEHLLVDLHTRLLEAGEAAREQLTTAMRLYLSGGSTPAGRQAVVDGDVEIDRAWLTVERETTSILARHQPVSGDLRTALAALQSALHVERVGDTAVDIVEAMEHDPGPPPEALATDLREMADTVVEMVGVALAAFEHRDRDRVVQLPELDDRVDALHAHLLQALRGAPELGSEVAVPVFHVSRLLERAGDHAVDIAEQVWFMLTGELVELNGRRATDLRDR